MPEERSKTALVLAGGGIMGAAYEIGCLTAIDRLFVPGFTCRSFDTYIGVSAGAVIATLIANRIPPALLYRILARNEMRVFNWHRSDIYRFDLREVLASSRQALRNLYRIFRHYRQNRWKLAFSDLFHILQEQFPAGLYSLGPMEEYLCNAFRREGVIDDFHRLRAYRGRRGQADPGQWRGSRWRAPDHVDRVVHKRGGRGPCSCGFHDGG